MQRNAETITRTRSRYRQCNSSANLCVAAPLRQISTLSNGFLEWIGPASATRANYAGAWQITPRRKILAEDENVLLHTEAGRFIELEGFVAVVVRFDQDGRRPVLYEASQPLQTGGAAEPQCPPHEPRSGSTCPTVSHSGAEPASRCEAGQPAVGRNGDQVQFRRNPVGSTCACHCAVMLVLLKTARCSAA